MRFWYRHNILRLTHSIFLMEKTVGSLSPLYRRPRLFGAYPSLVAAESTRHGGVSKAPYASLNLGLYTADDPAAVQENRRRFFHSLGASEETAAGAHQVHGDRVLRVEASGQYEGFDALVTNRPGVFLTVTVADCTPILLYDPRRQVVAAVHAGWRGTVAGIAAKALAAMQREYGAAPADCLAYIGACIDECSYEVDADVADHFPTPFRRWDPGRQKFFLDLKAANRAQLVEAGVPAAHIEVSPHSTVLHNHDYFSHRAEGGRTGRMLALIGRK